MQTSRLHTRFLPLPTTEERGSELRGRRRRRTRAAEKAISQMLSCRTKIHHKLVGYRWFAAAVTLKCPDSQPTHCLPPTQPLGLVGGGQRDLQSTLKLKFEDFGRFWASSLFADCSPPPPAAPPMDRNIQSSLHFQSTYRRLQHCTSIHSIAFQQQARPVYHQNKQLE